MARLASALVLLGVVAGVGADAPASGSLRKTSGTPAMRQSPNASAQALKQPKAAAAASGRTVRLHAEVRQSPNASAQAPLTPAAVPRQQVIRVCNAHPDPGGLTVFHDDGDSLHMALTGKAPIPTKSCREFARMMRVGDFLELRVPSQKSPVYLPSAPVADNTVALVVVYEKAGKPGIWLHYFDHLVNPQVAAVDATGGSAQQGKVDLVCVTGNCDLGKPEAIPFGGVAPVHPGHYSVSTPDGQKVELDAVGGGSYAVLIMGPGETIVFPSPQKPVYSGAGGARGGALLVLGAAAVLGLA